SEMADEHHATENPPRLYGDQPVLRDGSDDLAEGPREEEQVPDPKGHHPRNRYAWRPDVEAEEVVSGKQHGADEPGGEDDRRADRPAPAAPLLARQRADSHVEPDPAKGRGNRLDHYLQENERHRAASLPAAWPAVAIAARRLARRVPSNLARMSAIGLAPLRSRQVWYSKVPMHVHVRYYLVPTQGTRSDER